VSHLREREGGSHSSLNRKRWVINFCGER
jgi:hypothetical protein